ncbi:MAG: helix-turn-helix domain-containing protein [Planctomycetes bacterium]|nr:helix-turn-helix domain-containing protein [Planctomycetota bacterium]
MSGDALPPSERLLLTIAEVAVACGVSERSILRSVQGGELRLVQAPGTRGNRGRRVARAELLRWLAAQGDVSGNAGIGTRSAGRRAAS